MIALAVLVVIAMAIDGCGPFGHYSHADLKHDAYALAPPQSHVLGFEVSTENGEADDRTIGSIDIAVERPVRLRVQAYVAMAALYGWKCDPPSLSAFECRNSGVTADYRMGLQSRSSYGGRRFDDVSLAGPWYSWPG